MINIEKQNTNVRDYLQNLSLQDFANLGIYDYAYVVPARDEEGGFAVNAADGTTFAIAPSRHAAQAIIVQNRMEPMEVH